MDKVYSSSHVEKEYNNSKKLQRRYGKNVADGIYAFLQAVDAAENALDLKRMPKFYLHRLYGNYIRYYSVAPAGKSDKHRIKINMLNAQDLACIPEGSVSEDEFLISIKKIKIWEVSDHDFY